MITLNLSVHDVVDTILRRGHLDNRIFNRSSMEEGSHLHSMYQAQQGSDYLSEYPVELTFDVSPFHFRIQGKADGVILGKDGSLTIEEIKTTVADLDEFIRDHGEWHLGQALFYAYGIAKSRNKDNVTIVMTYIRQQNYAKQRHITLDYTMRQLEDFVNDVILRYARYMEKLQKFKDERDASIPSLTFPFRTYRPGQESLMAFVDDACDQRKKVYIEAPTGSGKTISVLYPLVKRFGEKKADHVYYLTNKNSIKRVAMSALRLFDEGGAKLKAVELTARDNICFNDKKGHCNPTECPFARDYYTKLNDAIFDALYGHDIFDRKTIEEFCYRHHLCPFEFQMDLSRHCDVQVSDYNTVFDINVQMFLEEAEIDKSHSYLAIDECHNLPERVRDMYSLTVEKAAVKDSLSLCSGREFMDLKASIEGLLKAIETTRIDTDQPEVNSEHLYLVSRFSDDIETACQDILRDFKSLLKKHPDLITDPLLDFFYNINCFNNLMLMQQQDDLTETFLTYFLVDNNASPIGMRIANLDPRPLIKSGTDLFESTIYFSATLSPKDYYIDLLGGDIQDAGTQLTLPSPFPKENRRVFVDGNLSLRYKDRNETLYAVYLDVKAACSAKKGNYFVFCPSFEYLEALHNFFIQDPIDDSDVYYQWHSMSEQGRDEFLAHFSNTNEKTTIGVMVIGGIFSEGIDLVGNRLIGSIIISVGLPQISFERNKIKEYYDRQAGEKSQKGFSYAYTYPGINRILQAAGRVIRSENDRGFMLFIDSRFRFSNYRKALTEAYPDVRYLYSVSQLRQELKRFWKETENHEI